MTRRIVVGLLMAVGTLASWAATICQWAVDACQRWLFKLER